MAYFQTVVVSLGKTLQQPRLGECNLGVRGLVMGVVEGADGIGNKNNFDSDSCQYMKTPPHIAEIFPERL